MGCRKLSYHNQEAPDKTEFLSWEIETKPDPGQKIRRTTYTFAFQGQERDDEMKGAGNSYNYKYRMHDPRLGRFLSIDPLAHEYPYYSQYAFSGNRVIDAVELEGLEPNPLNWVAAGMADFANAWVNFFTFEASADVNLTYTKSGTQAGATGTVKVVNTAYVKTSYVGWSVFDPSYYAADGSSSIPSPEFESTVGTKSETKTEVKTDPTPNSTVSTTITVDNKTGKTSTTTAGEVKVPAGTGMNVTVSTSAKASSDGTLITNKISYGPGQGDVKASIFLENKVSKTSDGTTSTTSIGVNVNVQTPSVEGASVGASATAKAGVKTELN